MYEHCFKSFDVDVKSKLRKANGPLVGFSGETYHPLGLIDLRVTMGEPGKSKTVLLEFAIVKCRSPYNVIIGRTEMRILREVGLTIHSMIKFLTDKGVATMRTSKEALWEYKQIETNAKFMEGDAMMKEPMITEETWEEDTVKEKVTIHDDRPDQRQKGGNADVYLEEVVVKSKTEESLIEDIKETMHKLRRVNIKIDPSKCTCGMEEGNFLKQSSNAYFLCESAIARDRNLPHSDKEGGASTGSHDEVPEDNLSKAQSQSGNRRPHGRDTETFRYRRTTRKIGSGVENISYLIRPKEGSRGASGAK
nr:reverse transcriptase domain-containing protein [Tanacetum cinerariifolium]